MEEEVILEECEASDKPKIETVEQEEPFVNCSDITSSVWEHEEPPERPPKKMLSDPPPVPRRTCINHIEQIQKLQFDLEEAKNLNAIAQSSWSEELQKAERRYEDELQVIQTLMQENVQEAVRATKQECEGEHRRLRTAINKLELEISSYRSPEKDNNVFSSMKTLARKVGNLTPNMLSATSLSNTFLSMDSGSEKELSEPHLDRKTSTDNMFQSIIASLGEEILLLKDKVRIQDQQLQMYEASQVNLVRGLDSVAELLKGRPIDQIIDELSDKIGQVSESVTVGMNIADLELYTAMLTTQKAILTDEKERLKSQLRDVQMCLEMERHDHSKLKKAWSRANDQYMVQQRAQLKEIRRLTNFLTTDHSIDSKGESERELEESSMSSQDFVTDPDTVILRSLSRQALAAKPDVTSVASGSSSSYVSTALSTSCDSTAGDYPDTDVRIFGVTRSNSSRSETDDVPRLVSEEQWQLLQDEIKAAHVASQACTVCSSLRSEYSKVKAEHADLKPRCMKAETEAERLRKELAEATRMFRECEQKWLDSSREAGKQVDSLYNDYSQLVSRYEKLNEKLKIVKKETNNHIRTLKFDRVAVSREVFRLQEENDRLVGKHSLTAAELSNEDINLPSDVPELQEELLKMREELIKTKIAKENAEEKMESEVKFFKDAAECERASREQQEEELSAEIHGLREDLGSVQSYQSQWEEEVKKNDTVQLTLSNLKQQVKKLMEQLQDLQREKEDKEHDILELKSRLASLQSELKTSEEVQLDFVKLSQTLQMQLETIRQAEKEVRWQHEDDAAECPTCKHGFNMMKKKHRCKHCGHIFCGDCLNHTVHSGPHRRTAKVCNVCYYLLVPESTPFFGQS